MSTVELEVNADVLEDVAKQKMEDIQSDEQKNIVQRLVSMFDRAYRERANFSNHWQEIAEVIMPAGAVFTENNTTQGSKDYNDIYDSTGIHANELLSSGLFSMLTSPTSPWFTLALNDFQLNEDYNVKVWLTDVARILAYEIQRPQTGFTTAMHECYLEYGAYGNTVLYETESADMSSLLFQCIPLAESYFIENDEGVVDTLIRYYKRTASQLVERFGIENVSKEVRAAHRAHDEAKKFEVIHFIMPNFMAQYQGIYTTELPYLNVYIEKTSKHMLRMSGFEEKPFMAARFSKMPNEVYGRGPGSSSLPDLNMLQEIMRTIIRGAQKMVDPALQMPDQGFLNPPRVGPGYVNYYRAGTQDRIEPLMTNGQPQVGDRLVEGLRATIREMFFVDQLLLNTGPQMTATEVMQRTEEKLRLMGPVVGRASSEILSPMIIRSFGLLMRAGKLPEPPPILMNAGVKLRIIYNSPIFKAQEQVSANNFMRVTETSMPLLSADPQATRVFNAPYIIRDIGNRYGLDPRYFYSDEELAAQQQQQQQMAAMSESAAQLKDIGIGMNNLAGASNLINSMADSGMSNLGGL